MDSKVNLKKFYSSYDDSNLEKVIKGSLTKIKDPAIKNSVTGFLKRIYHKEYLNVEWENLSKLKRYDFINKALSLYDVNTVKYLEVGVFTNQTFETIKAKNKISVDPDPGSYPTFLGTSDEFFNQNNEKFDVIFIDGLHHYDQCQADAINSLKCLNKNGFIFFHDFIPRNFLEEYVPRRNELWTGDCWKVSIELAKTVGIEFKVILADHGVGMVRKLSENTNYFSEDTTKLKHLRFKDFLELNESVHYQNADLAYESIK
tara:strand:+ start:465 stop:1241 length:777 start_codon:yes stop_codon:yes gene_type:complete